MIYVGKEWREASKRTRERRRGPLDASSWVTYEKEQDALASVQMQGRHLREYSLTNNFARQALASGHEEWTAKASGGGAGGSAGGWPTSTPRSHVSQATCGF